MTKADKISLGKRMNAVRKDRQFTADALSEICGVDPVYIRMIESGARTPSMSMFIKVCNTLRVSPSYLLSESLDENTEDRITALSDIVRNLAPKNVEIVAATVEAMIEKMD